MKLFLMRHAQAQEAKDQNDVDRELTEVGIIEASHAAESLQQYQIDKIIVSYARRTQQTSEIVNAKVKCHKLEILPELYASRQEKILEIISMQDDIDKNILVIAHNPGIFKTALQLVDNNSDEYDMLLEHGMPTANIIILDFSDATKWLDVVKGHGKVLS
jgi:phosphohistidine phosphatase